jgi:hypothetical protein
MPAFRCDRVRINGDIVEYFFSRRNVDGGQDEHVILNIEDDGTAYEAGESYMIPDRFEPASPR